MKVKIRQLPDGNSYLQRSDFFVIAQTSGGQVTRKLTVSQLASKLYLPGSYCSINSAGRIDVDAAGINALLEPRFGNIESRLGALEGKVGALEGRMGAVETKQSATPTQAPTTVYFDGTHVSSGGQSQGSASTAVVNLAKSIFSNLPAGSTVMLRWYRYWSWGTGNGSASRAQYFVGEYRANGGTNWTFVKNTHLSG